MHRLLLLCGLLALHQALASDWEPTKSQKKQSTTGGMLPVPGEETRYVDGGESVRAGSGEHPSLMRSPRHSRQVPGQLPMIYCGKRKLMRGSFMLNSPRNGASSSTNYPNNHDCSYCVRSAIPQGMLQLTCDDFKLEDSKNCTADFLYVAGMGRFCGSKGPSDFFARTLKMRFRTNSTGTGAGFNCWVYSLAPGVGLGSLPCGVQRLDRGRYSLLSKNFPDKHYDNFLHCGWELKASIPTDSLTLKCGSFSMEFGDCMSDWMRVKNTRYCGTDAPPFVTAVGNLTVEYKTDMAARFPGFNCTVIVSA